MSKKISIILIFCSIFSQVCIADDNVTAIKIGSELIKLPTEDKFILAILATFLGFLSNYLLDQLKKRREPKKTAII
jgi:hypothetical protein